MRSLYAGLLAGCLLTACGNVQQLPSRPAAVPAGVDLSGQWVLQETAGSSQRAARETAVYAFYENGSSVKITQTAHGLFISFDRSVVEEYRFGENRQVSVGAVSAQRVSGWDGRKYVIDTLDSDGAHLVDTYRLDAQGRQLVRTAKIVAKNREHMAISQTFARSIGE